MSRRRLPFTPGQVAAIGELRPAGASWRAIGRAIGRPQVGCRRLWIGNSRCWRMGEGLKERLSMIGLKAAG